MLQGFLDRVVSLAPYPQPALKPTRYPVVLMHGFGAIAGVLQGGVLHAEALALRAHGHAAYAPHVNPYDRTATRAAAWAERLEHILEETGADRLNLVAHSSGGLDARILLADAAWRARIASLVTVGTPHRGSEVAAFVLDHPQSVQPLVERFMTGLGGLAYPHALPDPQGALYELTPAFSDQVPTPTVPDGVYGASYAGRAGLGTPIGIYPPLTVPNHILYRRAGVNDGLVAVSSAWWGERRGVLDADHARQVGLTWLGGVLDRTPFRSRAFYVALAADLRERGL